MRQSETIVPKDLCPFCNHDELVEGFIQSMGLNYFRPKQTKFWTLKDMNVETRVQMCTRCGGVAWFGDLKKLNTLKQEIESSHKAPPAEPPKEAPSKG